jgi:hypothetical protein
MKHYRVESLYDTLPMMGWRRDAYPEIERLDMATADGVSDTFNWTGCHKFGGAGAGDEYTATVTEAQLNQLSMPIVQFHTYVCILFRVFWNHAEGILTMTLSWLLVSPLKQTSSTTHSSKQPVVSLLPFYSFQLLRHLKVLRHLRYGSEAESLLVGTLISPPDSVLRHNQQK